MKRIDVIGQNGNDGEHYEAIELAKKFSIFYFGTEDRYRELLPRAIHVLEKTRCPYATLTGDEE